MATYRYKGRDYQAAQCEHCGAAVTMTDATFRQLHKKAKEGVQYRGGSTLYYFDANIPCCGHPDYYWRP